MFDEPEEPPEQRPIDPAQQAREKCDEFRMHAELCAIFEGVRKYDAQILPSLDPEVARECQKMVGKLEKAKMAETPVIEQELWPQASALLDMPITRGISTNDYHVYRRPGEVMIVRWLAGEQVDTYYSRLQAHFDVALKQLREDEQQSHGWKQDPQTQAYLAELEKLEVRMEDRYLRPLIRQHGIFVLSTQAADEMDILHLCDYVMGVPAAEVVGERSAPPEGPSERDRAWFFKNFSLRGVVNQTERMCFFTYLQKSDDGGEW